METLYDRIFNRVKGVNNILSPVFQQNPEHAAKAIEQITLDEMKKFTEWCFKNHYHYSTHQSNWFDSNGEQVEADKLLQEYINQNK